jgi:hypothetical protein
VITQTSIVRAVNFLIAIFFAVATCILVTVGSAMISPGTTLDAIWSLYPARRALLMPYREWLGPGFLVLAVAMVSASIGCFLRRKWGWRLAVTIFAINGLSDVAQIAIGHIVEGAIGASVAGVMIFYLTRPAVKAAFV